MEHIVYFADKSVLFACQRLDGAFVVEPDGADKVSRAKILKILENHNSVVVVSADPERAYASFAAEFIPVEAAGGVVVDGRGRWLMICRNGRWDLPKGHIEMGESPSEAAVREIAEETGVDGTQVVRLLCTTQHAYYFPRTACWELKRTHWFELCVAGSPALSPQIEEGIELVAWCTEEVVAQNLQTTFPTIRRVACEMKG